MSGRNIVNIQNTINISNSSTLSNNFKSIILLNADKLTIDAQSALRRCIELYNHNTRFFIIVEDKNKILKPILSRFSEFYCNKKIDPINKYNKNFNFCLKKTQYFNKYLKDLNKQNINDINNIINITSKLYNLGISANILISYIQNKLDNNSNKYIFLIIIDNYKKYIRSEELLIFFCINFIFFRNNLNLNNIDFI